MTRMQLHPATVMKSTGAVLGLMPPQGPLCARPAWLAKPIQIPIHPLSACCASQVMCLFQATFRAHLVRWVVPTLTWTRALRVMHVRLASTPLKPLQLVPPVLLARQILMTTRRQLASHVRLAHLQRAEAPAATCVLLALRTWMHLRLRLVVAARLVPFLRRVHRRALTAREAVLTLTVTRALRVMHVMLASTQT